MSIAFYKPEKNISGPSYSRWFKLTSTVVSIGLALYAVNIALRYPLLQYGLGVKVLLLCAVLMLIVSYYWFLRSTITIGDKGITQTWLFPPRLVVRTGNSFSTLNGGTHDVLVEFAKISLAFQLKK